MKYQLKKVEKYIDKQAISVYYIVNCQEKCNKLSNSWIHKS